MSERRDDKQSANKNISLNVSIKYINIVNRRDADFINEIDFNQYTLQSFMQNYNSSKENNKSLNPNLQDL